MTSLVSLNYPLFAQASSLTLGKSTNSAVIALNLSSSRLQPNSINVLHSLVEGKGTQRGTASSSRNQGQTDPAVTFIN